MHEVNNRIRRHRAGTFRPQWFEAVVRPLGLAIDVQFKVPLSSEIGDRIKRHLLIWDSLTERMQSRIYVAVTGTIREEL